MVPEGFGVPMRATSPQCLAPSKHALRRFVHGQIRLKNLLGGPDQPIKTPLGTKGRHTPPNIMLNILFFMQSFPYRDRFLFQFGFCRNGDFVGPSVMHLPRSAVGSDILSNPAHLSFDRNVQVTSMKPKT